MRTNTNAMVETIRTLQEENAALQSENWRMRRRIVLASTYLSDEEERQLDVLESHVPDNVDDGEEVQS